jgi:hypothetical protein
MLESVKYHFVVRRQNSVLYLLRQSHPSSIQGGNFNIGLVWARSREDFILRRHVVDARREELNSECSKGSLYTCLFELPNIELCDSRFFSVLAEDVPNPCPVDIRRTLILKCCSPHHALQLQDLLRHRVARPCSLTVGRYLHMLHSSEQGLRLVSQCQSKHDVGYSATGLGGHTDMPTSLVLGVLLPFRYRELYTCVSRWVGRSYCS